MTPRTRHGFTLIEMSLVLAIVGLLTGGIMAGQSLLKNGQLTASVSELNKYKTAILQFRDQYRYWPGDYPLATNDWTAVGGGGVGVSCFGTANVTKATCNGNGDGLVAGTAGAVSTDSWYFGEVWQAWKHLADAGLIDGAYNGVSGSLSNADVDPGTNAPASSLKGYGYVFASPTAGSAAGRYVRDANDYEWRGETLVPWHDTAGALLTESNALFIDTKMDDGLPGTGSVRGYTSCGTTTNKYTAKYNLSQAGLVCRLEVYLRDPTSLDNR